MHKLLYVDKAAKKAAERSVIMEDILRILEKNARISTEDIATMTQKTPQEVAAYIDSAVKDNVINGYRTLVDWQKAGITHVQALIDLKVTPRRDCGFDEIAKRIAEFDEVESVHLMSGGYDLSLLVSGESFQDIALFVAKRLSLLDGVVSTATHFFLHTYKKGGALYEGELVDERERTGNEL